jgi:hypothetical protein
MGENPNASLIHFLRLALGFLSGFCFWGSISPVSIPYSVFLSWFGQVEAIVAISKASIQSLQVGCRFDIYPPSGAFFVGYP